MLLVVPGAGDVEAAVTRLTALGVGAFEARQQLLRGVPFAIACDVERARGTAIELKAVGVEAVAVDDEAYARAPPLLVVRSFRFFAEGLEVTTRPTAAVPAATHAIRWPDVELVMAARSVQSTVVHSEKSTRKIGMNPMKALRAKREVDHRREEAEERFALVLARAPDALLRFDMHGLDYLGLAERRQAVARANYDLVVGTLRAGATAARFDDRLEKLASRLSGAPTTSTTTAQTSSPLVKKTERAFSNDNEGAVVGAARLLCLARRIAGP